MREYYRKENDMYVKRAVFFAMLCTFLFQPNRTRTITTCSPAKVAIFAPSNLRQNISALQQEKELELLWIFLDKQNTSVLTVIDNLSRTFNTKGIAALVGSGLSFIDGLAAELANHFAVPFISLKSSSQGDNVISLLPSEDSKLRAFISIAVELACGRITVITSHLDNQILFSDLAHRARKIALVLTVVKLKQSTSEWTKSLQVSKEILVLNKSGACMVVMDTNPTDTEMISKTMSSLGVSSKKFVWIAFDSLSNSGVDTFIDSSIALNCPFTHMELVADAISLVNKTLHRAPSFKKRLLLIDNETDIETRRTLGRHFYRMLTLQKFQGVTGKIAFNRQGKRDFYKYDIAQLNIERQSQHHWTTVGAVNSNRTTFYNNFWQKATDKPSSMVLRMVTIEEDPVTIVSKEKIRPGDECILSHPCYKYKKTSSASGVRQVEKYCCSGFMFDILELLQQDLNFQPDIYFVEDERYGAYNTKTLTWNGMISDILQGKADMTLSMLTINEIRSRVIDYSPALLHSETKIMISVAKSETTLWDFAFFYPFSTNLWIVGVALVNVMLVILWSFDRFSPYGHYKHNYGNTRQIFNLPACMSYVWGLVFKLQLDNVTPRATSTRFTSVIFAFFTLVLISTYTANLAAYLVKTREEYPISDIRNKQFTDSSLGFKFATLESSSIEMLFSRSHDPTFRRIYQNMKPYQVGTYKEAIAKLRSRKLDAFIDDSPYLDLAASKQADCSFRIIGRPIKMNTLGIVFRRGSKWIEPITNLLLKYQRKDHFRKLRQKWFSGVCANAETKNEANELAAKHFGGLFLVCCAAVVVCGLLLIIELVWYRSLKRFLFSYNVKQIEHSNVNHEIPLSRTNIRELLPMSTLEISGGYFPDSNTICTELESSFTNEITLQ